MKKKLSVLTAALAVMVGTAAPSYADGVLGDVGSFLGSVTATIFDAPEGVLYYSLWRCPLKTTQYLADKFGDSKGFQQNVAGAVLGVPTGFLWGIPYGAVRGAGHGMKTGWEKPFSTESFIVVEKE